MFFFCFCQQDPKALFVKINICIAIVKFAFQATAPLLQHVTKVYTGRASPFPNITIQTDSKHSNQGEWDG